MGEDKKSGLGGQIMIRIYTEEMMTRLFLSPYTSIKAVPNGYRLIQTLFGLSLDVPADPEKFGRVLSLLQNGSSEKELLTAIADGLPTDCDRSNLNEQMILSQMIRVGIVE